MASFVPPPQPQRTTPPPHSSPPPPPDSAPANGGVLQGIRNHVVGAVGTAKTTAEHVITATRGKVDEFSNNFTATSPREAEPHPRPSKGSPQAVNAVAAAGTTILGLLGGAVIVGAAIGGAMSEASTFLSHIQFGYWFTFIHTIASFIVAILILSLSSPGNHYGIGQYQTPPYTVTNTTNLPIFNSPAIAMDLYKPPAIPPRLSGNATTFVVEAAYSVTLGLQQNELCCSWAWPAVQQTGAWCSLSLLPPCNPLAAVDTMQIIYLILKIFLLIIGVFLGCATYGKQRQRPHENIVLCLLWTSAALLIACCILSIISFDTMLRAVTLDHCHVLDSFAQNHDAGFLAVRETVATFSLLPGANSILAQFVLEMVLVLANILWWIIYCCYICR